MSDELEYYEQDNEDDINDDMIIEYFEKIDMFKDRIIILKSEISELEGMKNYFMQQIRVYEKELRDIMRNINEHTQTLNKLKEEKEKLESDIDSLNDTIIVLKSEIDTLKRQNKRQKNIEQ